MKILNVRLETHTRGGVGVRGDLAAIHKALLEQICMCWNVSNVYRERRSDSERPNDLKRFSDSVSREKGRSFSIQTPSITTQKNSQHHDYKKKSTLLSHKTHTKNLMKFVKGDLRGARRREFTIARLSRSLSTLSFYPNFNKLVSLSFQHTICLFIGVFVAGSYRHRIC